MMPDTLYDMIFKRKSFHLFQNTGKISAEELMAIENRVTMLRPLYPEIRTAVKIVPAEKTTCRRGEEYCILFYSEQKDGYLQNIGYLGEQLDLYLASVDIGALWFGIGKPEEDVLEGLAFVIMIGIAKMPSDKFRKDMFKSKRKPIEEIWNGQLLPGITHIVRFAPSACNTQPWKVEADGDVLWIWRYKKPGKRGIMPAAKVVYYNRIDIGIFLLFLELCLEKEGKCYTRTLFSDPGDEREMTLFAQYKIR